MTAKSEASSQTTPDPAEFSKNLMQVAEISQKLIMEFLQKQDFKESMAHPDPLNVGPAFMELSKAMLANPQQMLDAQMNLWSDYMALWQNAARSMSGETGAAAAEKIEPARGDKRFRGEAWNDNQIFDFLKQSYLLTSRWLSTTVNDVEGLSPANAKKVDFYTRQFIDAMSPSNFVMTNPEVLRATVEENGENLVRGLNNMLEDLERGNGKLAIRMTDLDAFEVGRNVAASPGKVIWQSDLMQLLQFEPTTEKVTKRPLLIVPPWINKYYILDLKEKNSFIKWAVDQGQTVFVVSWVNPDQALADKSFEDYMFEGIFAALDGVKAASGEDDVNIIGYCLGGTLTAATLGYMKAIGDTRIKSATFFTSLVDFEEAGELGIFIDEEQLKYMDHKLEQGGGILEGADMASTFNMLRANDLIWSFVVNNYLMGKDPFPFDLLYWNADATRMPAKMHTYYLREMYQKNLLSTPGGLQLAGENIDLTKINIPVHIISTKEDHIAPWKATYVATQLYSGKTTFTLAGSGHIAGIVNPPAANKYCYWSNPEHPPQSDDWLAAAERHDGSWWPQWAKWLGKQSGRRAKVAARVPGDGDAKVLEDAPGSYVRVRSDG